MDLVDFAKLVGPVVGGFAAGWVWPKVRKAIKNRGKTEQEIAAEELDRALAHAETAHHDDDPTNDAQADAEVQRTRAELNRIRRARAVWDGIADDDKEE